MGVHSTVDISRESAEDVIRKFAKGYLDKLSDDEISDILFAMVGDRHLHNFSICEGAEGERDWMFDFF